jgi:hypothetical protein
MERPILGWGQENFSYIFNKYYDPSMYGQEQWFDRAHNEFLDWLVAAGIPALLLYISFFILALIAIVRSKNLSIPEQAVLIGILAAYGFNNLFVFDNLVSLIYFYLILALCHGESSRALPRWSFMAKRGDDRVIAVAAPIVIVAVVGGLWVFNGTAMLRAQTLILRFKQEMSKGSSLHLKRHSNMVSWAGRKPWSSFTNLFRTPLRDRESL